MNFHPTHKGLFVGIVPVFIDMTNEDEPILEARNWASGILFDVIEPLFGLFMGICEFINPYFEPSFPIKITGQL